MLNEEAKYRSPKWLRNFIDYEVNTGEDIKGEPSKKRIAELEKEKEIELKRQADLKEKASRDAYNIRREKERQEQINRERKKQEEIDRDINTLYYSIISDFTKARYSDKIKTPRIGGIIEFHYTFEDGRTIKLRGKNIQFGDITYTLGVSTRSKFVSLANEMTRKATSRPTNQSKYTSQSGSTKSNSHPKSNLYNTLKLTIKQREEQLSKLTKNDPNRVSLENELENAKNKVKEMKVKYHFENLKSFNEFNILL